LAKTAPISVCDIGMIGPPLSPWKIRNTISASRLRESPHSSENSAKPMIAVEEHAHRAEARGQPARKRHADCLGHRVT